MRQLFSLGLAVALWGTFSAGRAQAIPIIHGAGYTITHVADLPPQVVQKLAEKAKQKQLPFQPNKLGFRYWRFHLFWADVWTSGGEFVAYRFERDRWAMPLGTNPATVARDVGLPEDKVYTPWLYTVPLGWWIVGGFFLFLILSNARGKTNSQPASESAGEMPNQVPFAEERLLSDPRYQQALREMNPHGLLLDELSLADIQRGIDSLVAQDVPRDEAEANLARLLEYLRSQQPGAQPVEGEPPG
jgi:hypothetical protein